jgi:hypothetical protein
MGYQLDHFINGVLHNEFGLQKALSELGRFEKEWQHWHEQNRFEWRFRMLGIGESAEFENRNHQKLKVTRLDFNVAKVDLAPNLTVLLSNNIYVLTGMIYEEFSMFESPFILKDVLLNGKTLNEEEALQELRPYGKNKDTESIANWFKHNLFAARMESLQVGQKLLRNNSAGTTFEFTRTENTFEVHTDISIDFSVRLPLSKSVCNERIRQIASILFNEQQIYAAVRDLVCNRYVQTKINGETGKNPQKLLAISACIANHYPPDIYALMRKENDPTF